MTTVAVATHIAIASVGLASFLLQVLLVLRVPGLRRRWWNAAVSFVVTAYVVAILVQLLSPAGPVSLYADRIAYGALLMIIPLLLGVSETYAGRLRPRAPAVLALVHLLLALVALVTNLVSIDSFSPRRASYISSETYPEAAGGPLETVFSIYLFLVATIILARWISMSLRSPRIPRWYLVAFLLWFGLAVQNVTVSFFAPGSPGLLTVGALVFAVTTMAMTVEDARSLYTGVVAAQEETRQILEASATPTVAFAGDYGVIYANEAFRRALAGEAGAPPGRFCDYVVAEDRDRLDELMARASDAPGRAVHTEFGFSRPDSGIVPMHCSLVVTAGRGEPTFVAGLTDLTEQKAREYENLHLALHDPLTGVGNRTSLDRRLEEMIRRSGDSGASWAVLLLDLDDFKSVNDTYGHEAGDEVLREAAKRIQLAIRDDDRCFRLGGDEFVVVTSFLSSPSDIEGLKLRVAGALMPPVNVGDIPIARKASVGTATYPDDGTDAASLLRTADGAMYLAKRAGTLPA